MLKNLVYLQPTTVDRGSLRLIPGSHKSPLFDELIRIGLGKSDNNESKFLKESGMRGEDIPCYIFCSQPDDVITFNQNTWHAAFGGYEDRRNCSFSFYSNPTTAKEEEDLHVLVEDAKTISPAMDLQKSPYYHPWCLANPEGSAKRARWIKSLVKWGFIEARNN
jgi:ectoine hydroxylase-related dioxygenase (phytanoyl-CoA dioxygenase family)